MQPRHVARSVILVLLAIGVATSCTGTPEEPPSSVPPTPALNATQAPLLPTDVATLPDATPASYEELLTQLQGTPVVVNIWGSWCDPCRREAPELAEAARTYGDRIQFLGVDILDTKTSARGFIEEFSWPYPSIYDPSPQGAIRSSLGYLGQPVTIFYAADGTKVADWEGAMSAEILQENLEKILPEAASDGA